MSGMNVKQLGAIVVASGFVTLASAFTAQAEAPASTPGHDVACLMRPAKLSEGDIKSFVDHPGALLKASPDGGTQMSTRVRSLAGSSSQAFNAILGLVKQANDNQKSAIASGLAQAVYACGSIGGDEAMNYAAAIQAAVASLGDPSFASTFQQSSKDISTASVGPGAAGYAVGGGTTETDDSPKSGTNGFRSPGNNPIPNTSGDYTVGGVNPVNDVKRRASPE